MEFHCDDEQSPFIQNYENHSKHSHNRTLYGVYYWICAQQSFLFSALSSFIGKSKWENFRANEWKYSWQPSTRVPRMHFPAQYIFVIVITLSPLAAKNSFSDNRIHGLWTIWKIDLVFVLRWSNFKFIIFFWWITRNKMLMEFIHSSIHATVIPQQVLFKAMPSLAECVQFEWKRVHAWAKFSQFSTPAFAHSQSILVRHCSFHASKSKRFRNILFRWFFSLRAKIWGYDFILRTLPIFDGRVNEKPNLEFLLQHDFYLLKLEIIVHFMKSKTVDIIHALIFFSFNRST